MTKNWNIAHYLDELAESQPYKQAIVYPEGKDALARVAYTHLTFAQLKDLCDRYAHGLKNAGVKPGDKALLMVKPGLDFIALTFAAFKTGALPVLIDPGMGWKGFMNCVKHVKPRVLLGIPVAHAVRIVKRSVFNSVEIPITLGKRWFWGGLSLKGLLAGNSEPFPAHHAEPEDHAAILFTSGSTGPAKGVVYTHRIFNTQVEIIRNVYGITSDDVDLPCFPLFALFSIALGATAVIPDMNPTKQAAVNPDRIAQAIENFGVTYSFGSPALWRTVAKHCVRSRISFPSLKKVMMAGAPIPAYLHRMMLENVLPEGAEVHTPYGATESLPVATFTGSRMLAETERMTAAGKGICVGKPLDNVTVKIIRISDMAIPEWTDELEVESGCRGEICVKGDVVTPEYYALPDHTAGAKIYEDGTIWHRIGDIGYFDEDGRLWFCGRKTHRVVVSSQRTMFTVCCEAIFNEHPNVYRSALVGVGENRYRRKPVLVVEPEKGFFPKKSTARTKFMEELFALANESSLTAGINDILFHPSFPVDIRHNAKINREVLAQWAASELEKGR